MKHFKKVGEFNPELIKKELEATPLWNWLNLRRMAYQSQHNYVDDIVLRFQPVQGKFIMSDFMDSEEMADYFVQNYLPYTMNFINTLTNGKKIGRIVIAKLKAGGIIGDHIDEGDYHKNYLRYHLVIDTNDKVIFTCEDEKQFMPQGTIWWFNNQVTHNVKNEGNTDRTHIVLDIKQ